MAERRGALEAELTEQKTKHDSVFSTRKNSAWQQTRLASSMKAMSFDGVRPSPLHVRPVHRVGLPELVRVRADEREARPVLRLGMRLPELGNPVLEHRPRQALRLDDRQPQRLARGVGPPQFAYVSAPLRRLGSSADASTRVVEACKSK